MIGRTLGHYRIDSKLGEGGMGVVYRARDTHLDRPVAIKVLPPEKVADPARKQRFVQEAKAASALNHPNIITIHDINSSDGVDFIVMEYVEGKALDELVPSKGMRPAQALKYAVQMADALAKAHGAGIIHRDLKPSNIMVTDEGRVKILDFGLAKLLEPSESPPDAPTVTARPLTEEGAVVGTAAYMSPEQAEGRKLDARSDIFSFGSVLYEMVTCQRPFTGDSRLSMLTKILNEDPKPPSQQAPAVPPELEKLILRCLRKDPARRFQTMADLKVALEDVQDESGSRKQVVATTKQSRRHWAWALAGGLALAAGYLIFQSLPPEAELIAVPLTSEPGYEDFASLSPDGKQVAYSWNGPKEDNFDIYVKLIGLPSQLRLTTDPARDSYPAWSPGGNSVAFLRELPKGRAALIIVTALGGPERKLAECDFQVFLPYINLAPAWTPDGKWLVIADRGSPTDSFALTAVAVDTGEKRRLTSPPLGAIGDTDAAISADGDEVAFVRTGSFLSSDVYLLSLSSSLKPQGDPVRLTTGNRVTSHPAWAPEGRDIIFAAGPPAGLSLWRVAARGRAAPRRLAYAGDDAVAPSVARQGRRLVYTRSLFDPNVWRVPIDGGKAGPPEAVISSTRVDSDPMYSPDGRRIAFESSRSGNYEIWVCDRDGASAVRLTSFEGPVAAVPRWSPDGERLSSTPTPPAIMTFTRFKLAAAGRAA